MNDYTVELCYNQFIITTIITADDEAEAERVALQFLTQDEGLNVGEPNYYQIQWEGSFAK